MSALRLSGPVAAFLHDRHALLVPLDGLVRVAQLFLVQGSQGERDPGSQPVVSYRLERVLEQHRLVFGQNPESQLQELGENGLDVAGLFSLQGQVQQVEEVRAGQGASRQAFGQGLGIAQEDAKFVLVVLCSLRDRVLGLVCSQEQLDRLVEASVGHLPAVFLRRPEALDEHPDALSEVAVAVQGAEGRGQGLADRERHVQERSPRVGDPLLLVPVEVHPLARLLKHFDRVDGRHLLQAVHGQADQQGASAEGPLDV